MWILRYDLHQTRKRQRVRLKQVLHLDESANNGPFIPWKCPRVQVIDPSHYGNARSMWLILSFCLFLLMLTVTLQIQHLDADAIELVALLVYGVSILVRLRRLYPRNGLKRTMADDWLICPELLGLWALWTISVIVELGPPLIYKLYFRDRLEELKVPLYLDVASPCYVASMVLFMTLWQTANVVLTLYIPWRTLQRQEAKEERLSLRTILSHNTSFLEFMEFSTNNASEENLAFLVEIWQFKYQQEMALQSHPDDSTMTADALNSRSYTQTATDSAEHSLEENGSNHSGDAMDVDVVTHLPGADAANTRFPSPIPVNTTPVMESNVFQYPSTDSNHSPLPVVATVTTTSCNTVDNKNASTMEVLRALPWSALPLNASIANHERDKMTQCVIIFERFVVREGPFALNISYATYLETKQRFEECHRRHQVLSQRQHTKQHDDDDKESASKMALDRDVLCVFDPVICDVFDNLENVANRYNVQRMMASDV